MDGELRTLNDAVCYAGMKSIRRSLNNRLGRRLDMNPNEVGISGRELDVEQNAILPGANAVRVLFQLIAVTNSCVISGMV